MDEIREFEEKFEHDHDNAIVYNFTHYSQNAKRRVLCITSGLEMDLETLKYFAYLILQWSFNMKLENLDPHVQTLLSHAPMLGKDYLRFD